MEKNASSGIKERPCLRCDKYFRTTPEVRICQSCCKNDGREDRVNYDRIYEKMYGDFGIFEKKLC